MDARFSLFAGVVSMLLSACSPQELVDTASASPDMAPAADLAPARPSCPAAEGVVGDVLMCADFSKIRSFDDPQLSNWDFNAAKTGNCWQLKNGFLTNIESSAILFLCAVSLPELILNDPKIAKYRSVKLVMKYSLDIAPDAQQLFRVFLVKPDNSHYTTGYEILTHPRFSDARLSELQWHNTISMERSAIPAALNGVFKPVIDSVTGYNQSHVLGWQFSSIALMGSN